MMQPELLTETLPSQRLVSVYNDPDLLREMVALWFTKNLDNGGGALVVCTSESWLTLGNRLRREGLDPDVLQETGRLRVIDADRFLMDFMYDGVPDPDVYHQRVARTQRAVRTVCEGAEVRVWNEGIDLLRQRDEPWAAEFLESLRLETTDENTVHLVGPSGEAPWSHLDDLEEETEWVPYTFQEPVTLEMDEIEAKDEKAAQMENTPESN